MSINPDTYTHNAINQWFSSAKVEEIVPLIRIIAGNVISDFEEIKNKEKFLNLDDKVSYQVAELTVLELIMGTLDPELVRTSIGERFKAKMQIVSKELSISDAVINFRDADEINLRRWFGEIGEFKNLLGH
ncbi:hypothetical protein [Paracidovorax valerianellae]|uniref:hypothetical protein n=1 Tax=Paracidovorax valerianellae TaxID=187868 RepID=UPI0011137056|nr:hypothetical protein [Paracidovorax valerianellae]MDA8445230.1 hypothetical protein [Paracidovorax valerianellae]